jgi:3-hydroxypropanoate dehydrogenase
VRCEAKDQIAPQVFLMPFHSTDVIFPMLETDALNTLFDSARTFSAFTDQSVSDALLQRVYDLAKMPPTAFNCSPMRVVFVRSAEAKAKLKPHLSPGNADKTMAAPVCAIIATDSEFHTHLPTLFPAYAGAQDFFVGDTNRVARETAALRNGSLQGAYFILAARALGLDCGPMSGFRNAGVDETFFPDGRFKSNFLCNLGYGDRSALHPRGPRFAFAEACHIV